MIIVTVSADGGISFRLHTSGSSVMRVSSAAAPAAVAEPTLSSSLASALTSNRAPAVDVTGQASGDAASPGLQLDSQNFSRYLSYPLLYLTFSVERLSHLPSTEVSVSVLPNAWPQIN